MKFRGPDKFKIIINTHTTFSLETPEGDGKVHGRAAKSKSQKLYVIGYKKKIIYVGITSQNIRNRLRMGFKAIGKGGFYGYAWRKKLKRVNMNVWYFPKVKNQKNMEAIEAELVYCVRKNYNQWPKYQTEIHFQQSNEDHIRIAEEIFTLSQNLL